MKNSGTASRYLQLVGGKPKKNAVTLEGVRKKETGRAVNQKKKNRTTSLGAELTKRSGSLMNGGEETEKKGAVYCP